MRSFPGATDLTCSSISFSASGTGLVTKKTESRRLAATFMGQVRMWDTVTGRVLLPARRQARFVHGVLFSPVSADMLAMLRDNDVTIVNVSPGVKEASIVLQPSGGRHFQAVAFSKEGRLAARAKDLTGAKKDHVLLWPADALTTAQGKQFDAPREELRANLAFIPESEIFVFGSSTKAAGAWGPSGALCRDWHLPRGDARLVAVSKKRVMATLDGGCNIDLWDLEAEDPVGTIQFSGDVFALAFSPDGSRLAVAGTKIQVYRMPGCRMLYELEGLKKKSSCLAFSSDGELLVTGGDDLSLHLWNARNGKSLDLLTGHASPIEGVAISPDGKRIASCSLDGSVKLWDTAARQEVLTLKGHNGPATGVAFSPDGLRLASCGQDGCVRIWDATPIGEAP
jgi:WD40 repeat protein